MKEFLKKYVLCPAGEPLLPKKYRENHALRIFVRAAGIVSALLCPLYLFLMLEYIHYGGKERLLVFLSRTRTAIFCAFVLYLLYFLLLLLMKRTFAASLTLTVLTLILGIVDRCKYAATGDYLYPWDIAEQVGNVRELLSFVRFDFTVAAVFLMAFSFAFAAVGLVSGVSLPLKSTVRLPLFFICVFSVYFSVSAPQKVTALLNRNGIYIEDTALQTSNYEANGFTGAFLTNILSSSVEKPENYSKKTVDELLSGREYEPQTADFCYPDIILVLSESFWDVKALTGVSFSENPTANFDRISSEDGVISGKMYQTGLGGGTVRVEFDVLTGLTTDGLPSGSVPWRYVMEDTESYASVLRDIGYDTLSLHPYLSSFYDRARAYPLIGIDRCCFEDELSAIDEVKCERVSNRGYISDDSFVSYIEYFLENADKPSFIFGISMENHQSYLNKYENTVIKAESSVLGEENLNMVRNFAEGLYHADLALGRLTEYVRKRERPTVLIWFGDHLPSLGGEDSAYVESGLLERTTGKDASERRITQATPFLVTSNYPFPFESELLSCGEGNEISSYNLLNGVLELIGAPRTALMQFLSDYASCIPYCNVRLLQELTKEQEKYVWAHKLLTYDRLSVGGRFSLE